MCARACVHAPVCTRVCIFRPQSLPSSCRGFLRTAQSTTKEVLPTAKPNAPCCAPRPSVWMHTCRVASARQSPCSSPLCPREGSLERTSRSALGESTRHPELMLINQQLILNRHPNCSSPLNAYHTRVPDTPLLASVNPRGSSAPLSPRARLQSGARAHRHFHAPCGLRGSVLAGRPAPQRGTLTTSERALYLIKQLPPGPWGAI